MIQDMTNETWEDGYDKGHYDGWAEALLNLKSIIYNNETITRAEILEAIDQQKIK